jgi:hypothetical protein
MRDKGSGKMFEHILSAKKWYIAMKEKQNCYHVLWIEREVAYRKSYGFNLEDEWERLTEPGKIGVTFRVNTSGKLITETRILLHHYTRQPQIPSFLL